MRVGSAIVAVCLGPPVLSAAAAPLWSSAPREVHQNEARGISQGWAYVEYPGAEFVEEVGMWVKGKAGLAKDSITEGRQVWPKVAAWVGGVLGVTAIAGGSAAAINKAYFEHRPKGPDLTAVATNWDLACPSDADPKFISPNCETIDANKLANGASLASLLAVSHNETDASDEVVLFAVSSSAGSVTLVPFTTTSFSSPTDSTTSSAIPSVTLSATTSTTSSAPSVVALSSTLAVISSSVYPSVTLATSSSAFSSTPSRTHSTAPSSTPSDVSKATPSITPSTVPSALPSAAPSASPAAISPSIPPVVAISVPSSAAVDTPSARTISSTLENPAFVEVSRRTV